LNTRIDPKALTLATGIFLSACAPEQGNEVSPAKPHEGFIPEIAVKRSETSSSSEVFENGETELGYSSIGWDDLIPKEELEILLNPPEYLNDIVEGSDQDVLGKPSGGAGALAADDLYQQALNSVNVRKEIDGQAVRVPGFVVPLEFDDNQVITQFFLVPYFGACIHMPPPPPNQIILVNYSTGLELDALYDPIWVSGMLKVSMTENNLGRSAYSMDMHIFEPYI
tara:strand:+ start:221 stop:895 length:675 start_codon:yes stop_codon:yes gene_type:complete